MPSLPFRADIPTVLYVEDHPVNVMLMQALFEQRPGLRLVVATDGADALRMAARLQPLLMLLDLRLPDCHGSRLLQWLRQLPTCRDVPAIAVTAEDDFQIAGTTFLELWAKPLNLRRVLERLDALTLDTPEMPLRKPPGPPAPAARALWARPHGPDADTAIA
jgi:CheY-like chemotaxis protein